LNIIASVFIRIRNLMFYSQKEWETIAAENNSRKAVYVRFVAPLLCIIAVTIVIGTWLNTSREVYSIGYVCYKIAIVWFSMSAGLYFSSFMITEIMALQVNFKDHNRSFALMAYSSGTAYLVIAIVALFPYFNEMLVLAFYSCYLYWRGIPLLIQAQGQKRMIYGLLSFIIIALIHLLMLFFFENVFRALFGVKI
jgi:hypothetical protein